MTKTAGIIIGDEILSGETVDTNSAFLCQELRTLGVTVLTPKDKACVLNAFNHRLQHLPAQTIVDAISPD